MSPAWSRHAENWWNCMRGLWRVDSLGLPLLLDWSPAPGGNGRPIGTVTDHYLCLGWFRRSLTSQWPARSWRCWPWRTASRTWRHGWEGWWWPVTKVGSLWQQMIWWVFPTRKLQGVCYQKKKGFPPFISGCNEDTEKVSTHTFLSSQACLSDRFLMFS